MSGQVLLGGGIAAIVGALVLAALVFAGGGVRAAVQVGLASIESGYAVSTVDGSAAGERKLSPVLSRLRSVAARLSPAGTPATLQRRLDVAGNPAPWTPERVLAFKGLGLVALGLLGAVGGVHSPVKLVLFAAAGAAAGFWLPDVLLYNAGLKRQDKIRRAMPDTLDMLTVCVEAGLGFDAALAEVVRTTNGPLSAEGARVLQEMQFGSSRVEALRSMAERTTIGELRVFVSALVQAAELGVPVGRVLREQSVQMRLRRRQRAEEQAQKVPVKILFPLLFCLFPALFVMVIGPGALSIMHSLLGR
jgi:tight adherence protein C